MRELAKTNSGRTSSDTDHRAVLGSICAARICLTILYFPVVKCWMQTILSRSVALPSRFNYAIFALVLIRCWPLTTTSREFSFVQCFQSLQAAADGAHFIVKSYDPEARRLRSPTGPAHAGSFQSFFRRPASRPPRLC